MRLASGSILVETDPDRMSVNWRRYETYPSIYRGRTKKKVFFQQKRKLVGKKKKNENSKTQLGEAAVYFEI